MGSKDGCDVRGPVDSSKLTGRKLGGLRPGAPPDPPHVKTDGWTQGRPNGWTDGPKDEKEKRKIQSASPYIPRLDLLAAGMAYLLELEVDASRRGRAEKEKAKFKSGRIPRIKLKWNKTTKKQKPLCNPG